MTRAIRLVLLFLAVTSLASAAGAARVRVVHGPHRTRVAVRTGFPIHRTFPQVVVRAPRVAVRVAPRVYLPPVAFGAVVVAAPIPPDRQVWSDDEDLDRDDEWTDFTMNVDKMGSRLLLQVDHAPAQVSFAEVVFDNGEARVVDFSDKVHRQGVYELLDFAQPRKVDHVRIIGKAAGDETELTLHLVS